MSVTVAAGGHYKPLAAVVNNFRLALFDKSLSTFLVADVSAGGACVLASGRKLQRELPLPTPPSTLFL